MFFDELSPLLKELTSYPVAFLGGFVSGVLRLNLAEEPVKAWLDQQAGKPASPSASHSANGKSGGPQTIAID